MTNRLAVTKALIVASVNGPAPTIIKGYQVPETTNGDGAIRCVYLTNGATLTGFTLTNGATRTDGDSRSEQYGGGIWCEFTDSVISNCVVAGNSAGHGGGGVFGGTLNKCSVISNSASIGGGAAFSILSNCVLSGNSASHDGGGARNSTLINCVLNGNASDAVGGGVSDCFLTNCNLIGNSVWNGHGGGAYSSTLYNCTLTSNSVAWYGGGARESILTNCSLIGNIAHQGGGAYYSSLNNCLLVGNFARERGGGADSSNLRNCVLITNAAVNFGGGACEGSGTNCTIVGNSAKDGGGMAFGTAYNSIVYYNRADTNANFNGGVVNSCAVPFLNTTGNITNEPAFVDLAAGNLRLAPNSPCINAGDNIYARGGVDLDGRSRIVGGTVDMGAYEFQSSTTNSYLIWLCQKGLSPSISSDDTDLDGDGMSIWQEWVADTNPTNANSVLRINMTRASVSAPLTFAFIGSSNRVYTLFRSSNPTQGLWTNCQSEVTGTGSLQTMTDTNSQPAGFYRLCVRLP
ncbi:MAG: choice-of-anchor Q domain-containing protein [Verrucomicrobiota bacterium]